MSGNAENQICPLLLVIDDDVEVTEFLEALLKTKIHEIIISHDIKSGVADALRYRPNLILLNVNLPDGSGIETCRGLKSDSRTAHIPIIIMTGDVSEPLQNSALEAGASGFINKPFDNKELISLINQSLFTPLACTAKSAIEKHNSPS